MANHCRFLRRMMMEDVHCNWEKVEQKAVQMSDEASG
jgi:hypothetical protein